ncbi:rod-binding protein [Trichloromonas sp.]|uniref:rod-binding protein n=1 Tax=Trichloromonas sp. TaxID=3069249 RepID=UPI002A4DE2F6|nr:rod-binding protein [Trichloromonas sp.]
MKLTQVDPSLLVAQNLKAAAKDTATQDDAALRQTCREFEAIFVQSMFKAMRSTVPAGGLFPRGMAQDSFQDMMDLEVAKASAEQGRFGIAEALYRQLHRDVEVEGAANLEESVPPPAED